MSAGSDQDASDANLETQEPRLETYAFLTPGVEIKKANLYGLPREQFWSGFLTPLL